MPKKKPAVEYPEDVIVEARLRRMRPDDYLRQMSECSTADQRMDEIDRKKLAEMQPEELVSD
jgi:hypothetical protein